jgi:Xaa-Pro aminopeptidase
MTPAFPREEYARRLSRVKSEMQSRGLDALVVGDAANLAWLTGYLGWSFYTPQYAVVLPEEDEPHWIGRAMDAPGALLSCYMAHERVHGYPEDLVQRPDRHPSAWLAQFLRERGHARSRIGYESDAYYFSPRSFASLREALPDARLVDADLLVNWQRFVKSDLEIECMRKAARLAETAMRTATALAQPGARQCDIIGAAYQAQIAGHPDYAGHVTSLCPLILAGKAASAAHPIWTEERLAAGQTIAFELAGAFQQYQCALARTVHLGPVPPRVRSTSEATLEGLAAVLGRLEPGMLASDVHASWQAVLDRHGLRKDSRIGYSIGLGLPPDWGEHTMSLRPGDATVLVPGCTFHVMLGMWMDGWGLEYSETVRMTDSGHECLTDFPRELIVH